MATVWHNNGVKKIDPQSEGVTQEQSRGYGEIQEQSDPYNVDSCKREKNYDNHYVSSMSLPPPIIVAMQEEEEYRVL